VHRDRFSDKRTFPARITSLPVNARAVDFVSAQRQIAAKGANDAPPAAPLLFEFGEEINDRLAPCPAPKHSASSM
jgi:hypothetical protein